MKKSYKILNKCGNIGLSNFVKKEILLGKEFYIFPVSMIVEGVYRPGGEGAGQKLFFSSEELEKSQPTWNGRPVSVDHPYSGGSMNEPRAFEDQWIGYVFKSRYEPEKKRIAAELWVDCSRGKWIEDRLSRRERIEVSIGAYGKVEPVEGVFLDKEYNFSYKDIRGDHLAVLANSEGACSWEDGCGIRASKAKYKALDLLSVPRNPDFKGTEEVSWEGVGKTLKDFIEGYFSYVKKEVPDNGENVKNLSPEAKKWIASKSLLGNSKAETSEDLIFFPVVNPKTNKLNSGALKAIMGSRGSAAKIPLKTKELAKEKARLLYERNFKEVNGLSGEKECKEKDRAEDLLSTEAIKACNRNYKGMDVEDKNKGHKEEVKVEAKEECSKTVHKALTAEDILENKDKFSPAVLDALKLASRTKNEIIAELTDIEFDGRKLCRKFLEGVNLENLEDLRAMSRNLKAKSKALKEEVMKSAKKYAKTDFALNSSDIKEDDNTIAPRRIKW